MTSPSVSKIDDDNELIKIQQSFEKFLRKANSEDPLINKQILSGELMLIQYSLLLSHKECQELFQTQFPTLMNNTHNNAGDILIRVNLSINKKDFD